MASGDGNRINIEDRRGWNEEILDKEFEDENANCIKSIELRFSEDPNVLGWHFGRKGRFSVRSAYKLFMQHLIEASTSSSNVQDRDTVLGWNFLWRAKVPPKVILLAWRACQEAIPVCYNLRRRGLDIASLCIRCGQESEDVLHVLLWCSFSIQAWALLGLPWRWINLEAGSTEEWMRSV
ncbi:UNVERIFIED_CONTAM: hypothetical protein Slati_3419900 [Sesamum latifolium]|uniref:Reverse transcriptase zinc-binding domain-containing protein n=1 Tax=Sesamum latifolium TaxID=2727402 RepID=A0AAW2UG80_9LAMI